MLALARRTWVLRLTAELESRGYPGYRLSDAAVMRTLVFRPSHVGRLGEVLGVSRQAARKVVANLEVRGLAMTATDTEDARRLRVVPTPAGVEYAKAIVEVVEKLNRQVAELVGPQGLQAADVVFRAVMVEERMRRMAERIPPPP